MVTAPSGPAITKREFLLPDAAEDVAEVTVEAGAVETDEVVVEAEGHVPSAMKKVIGRMSVLRRKKEGMMMTCSSAKPSAKLKAAELRRVEESRRKKTR